MTAQVLERPRHRGPAPTAADVVLLQSVREMPTASVLMPTRPGHPLDETEAARLSRLIGTAGARLVAEAPEDVAGRIVRKLRAMVDEAVEIDSGHGLALFASDAVSRWFALPVPVVERVVIDPTFATRDLVRSLHRTPLHVLLLLTPDRAELLECNGPAVSAARPSRFPMKRLDLQTEAAYLRCVDAALAAHLRARPSPVVVTGSEELAQQFVVTSRATTRFAGVVAHDPAVQDLDSLVERARPALERYLRSREREAVLKLQRTPRRRVASGLADVWLATRRERPEMLVVEEDYLQPARVSEDGDQLLPVEDATAPDVVDDVVDDVIEAVLRRGGWVATATPGALAAHGRIALTVRGR